jgi:hypothetical protein
MGSERVENFLSLSTRISVLMQFENTTNRSWWIIQTQPTRESIGRPSNPTNRSTAVGGFVHIQPMITVALAEISSNGRFFVG